MTKERIDKLMVDRGLAETRTKAQSLVMAGVVLVDDRRVDKASEKFEPNANIRLKGASSELKYVSRGGLKLEHALTEFGVDPQGMNCIDIGSSTGGFTDCLLQHGASKVTAIDAGTNQLAWSIRNDQRVEVHEKTNARTITVEDVSGPYDLAVMDVSFISVTKIIPAVVELLKPYGKLIVLIKPQFEVGRGEVGKGGIVRESEKHERVKTEIEDFCKSVGLEALGVIDSPILGAEGNKEFLALYAR